MSSHEGHAKPDAPARSTSRQTATETTGPERPGETKGVSSKKLEANRQNARRSTGPRTAEGKARVRRNALTHGLFAQAILLPDEDRAAFIEFWRKLHAELQPVGEREGLLVEQIVLKHWRLRRVCRVEAAVIASELSRIVTERAEQEAEKYKEKVVTPLTLGRTDFTVSQTVITDQQKYQAAVAKVEEAKVVASGAMATFGWAFLRATSEADAFSRLGRYEIGIERGLYRAYHELERLQRARFGHYVPPPVAIDVDVSGVSEEAL